ncbi:MAG TPA: hypothetical protein VIH27_03320 [Nitrososphaerales archaeon]
MEVNESQNINIVPSTEEPIKTEEQKTTESMLDEIIEKIKVTSRFMVVGINQSGKSNLMLHLMKAIRRRPEHKDNGIKMTAFDPTLNFRYKFDSIPYLDRTKIRDVPDSIQDLIVDIPFTTASLKRDCIMEVLLRDFGHKRTLKMQHNGVNPYYNFYIIDEMQNVFGSYALRSKEGETALTIFSESSNYAMVIMGISQRFNDVATGVIERCAYFLVGNLSGGNELSKFAKITGKKIANMTKSLKVGDFLFIDRSNLESVKQIHVPIFEQEGTPYPYEEQSMKWGVKERFVNYD